MSSRKRKIPGASSQPLKLMSKVNNIPEKVTLCICLSKFLNFRDFQSFVRSLWPNNDESVIIRARSWQLSTHIAEIPFINGKQVRIEFNYNPWRQTQDCILINVESLVPIFGRIIASAADQFTSVSKMENFVRMHVHLNRCSDYRYRSCSCHLKNCNPNEVRAFAKPSADECKFGHFHHYCSQHVNHWLKFVLNPLLAAKQGNNSPDNNDIQGYLSFLSNAIIL